MSKYIDAEKLIAEIERRIKLIPLNFVEVGSHPSAEAMNQKLRNGLERQLNSIKEFITSFQQEQPDNMIQWTGENLKEVIDFTGKSPRFDEWFKSWEEFESYVHSHGDILKLFSDDGSHYEVPVGAWIIKTPDGFNVASRATFKQQPAEWSEEDERNMNTLISVINAHYNEYDLVRDDYPINARNLGDWLKSLRSRPKPLDNWKPSEEQMKALGIALRCGIQLGTWEEDALRSLNDELKKLL